MPPQNPFDALPTGASYGTNPPPERVYSPGQIAVVTFLGGVLAGSILIGLNHHQHARSERGWWTVLAGLGATVVLMAIGFMLPENFPGIGIPIAFAFGMRAYATQLQPGGYGRDVRDAPSGRLAVVVGVGLGCLLLTGIVAVAAVILAEAAGLG